MTGEGNTNTAGPTSETYDLTIHPEIARLSDEELVTLRAALQQVIPIRETGIAYAESRRGQFASIAGAMLSLGIAIFPLSNLVAWSPGRWSLVVLGFCAVLSGLATWVMYAFQVNYPYPFVSVVPPWKWFYHQALPTPTAFGPSIAQLIKFRLRAPGLDAATKATKTEPYFKNEEEEVERQFGEFGVQVRGLSQKRVDATQDLRQLYRLHLNELYKNRFLTQLRKVLTTGITFSVFIPLLVLMVSVCTVHDKPKTSSDVISHDIETASTWIPTGRVRQNGIAQVDVEYRLVVTIVNRRASPVAVHSLTATDSNDRAIPAEFDMRPHTASVAPNASTQLIGYMWLPAEDAENLNTVNAS